MRKSRFTFEQMIQNLREGQGSGVRETARRHGISEKTYYTWKRCSSLPTPSASTR